MVLTFYDSNFFSICVSVSYHFILEQGLEYLFPNNSKHIECSCKRKDIIFDYFGIRTPLSDAFYSYIPSLIYIRASQSGPYRHLRVHNDMQVIHVNKMKNCGSIKCQREIYENRFCCSMLKRS